MCIRNPSPKVLPLAQTCLLPGGHAAGSLQVLASLNSPLHIHCDGEQLKWTSDRLASGREIETASIQLKLNAWLPGLDVHPGFQAPSDGRLLLSHSHAVPLGVLQQPDRSSSAPQSQAQAHNTQGQSPHFCTPNMEIAKHRFETQRGSPSPQVISPASDGFDRPVGLPSATSPL